MSSGEIGIEDARKILGDLVNRVAYTNADITLTRNGRPVARLAPLEPAMTHTPGARIQVPEGSIPSDWSHTGEIEEVKGETVIVRLDSGQLQELPDDEVTPA